MNDDDILSNPARVHPRKPTYSTDAGNSPVDFLQMQQPESIVAT
jgi:hypothetical protein